jgi:malonyl-CoA O-methyltransferase
MDKKDIRRSFAKASVSYDEFAKLQRNVGLNLLKMLENQIPAGVVLDLGCGTGFLTRELSRIADDGIIIAMDIAIPMLERARKKNKGGFFCGDIEKLPVGSGLIDCIFSNFALQWCVDLLTVFSQFRKVLKPDGQFFFSTFGPQTFWELKHAWAQVDDYSHVNHFYSVEEIQKFMRRAGLEVCKISNFNRQSYYPDVMTLMKEIKAIGAHNMTQNRNKNITSKKQLNELITAYEKFRINDKIPATYEVINIAGKLA